MTGLTSCCRKRTYGPPLLPGGLFQRRLPKRPSVKNDADCRPSIYGWRSSWAGTCWLTGCSQWLRLRSHVSNFVRCCSTRQPGAAKRIPMKKKYTVDLHTKQSRHGGSNAKSGWCTKCQCEPLVQDCKGFLRIPGQGRGCSCWGRGIQGILRKEVADKRGHLPAQATTTLAWCERSAWGRRCRSGHEGHLSDLYMDGMDDYYMVEEMLWGAERGAICFTFFANFHWPFWWVLGCFVFVCVCLFVCFFFFFWVKFCIQLAFHIFGRFPVVDRPCPVLARQCRKKKAMPTLRKLLTASLASLLLDTLFYKGLAGPHYLLEKNIWKESECRLAACPRPLFHAVSPSPGLVKLSCALQPTGMR